MFADYLYEQSPAKYTNKILLINSEHLTKKIRFTDGFESHGYEIVIYKDDLNFRINHEEKIKSRSNKIVVVVSPEQYIPYDIIKKMTSFDISFFSLFSEIFKH